MSSCDKNHSDCTVCGLVNDHLESDLALQAQVEKCHEKTSCKARDKAACNTRQDCKTGKRKIQTCKAGQEATIKIKSEEKQDKPPQIMVWLEPNRYVTLAYRFEQRPPTLQDLEKLIDLTEKEPRRYVIPTMLKVDFAGTIYRPDPEKKEPALPQHMRTFKREYQNMRALLRKEALRRFHHFNLSCAIDLTPFMKKLRSWLDKQADFLDLQSEYQQKLAADKNVGSPTRPRPPKALPPKPDFNAYLRDELRKLLLYGTHLPRNERPQIPQL